MSLSQCYVSSICEIKTMENDLIATGILGEVTEEYVELVPKAGKLKIVRYKMPVKISVYNTQYGFCVLAGEVFTSSSQRLRIVNVITLVEYERRNFFRVDTDISAELICDEKELHKIPVQVYNISLSGFLVGTQEELDQSRVYRLKLKLGRRFSTFSFRICRTFFPESGYKYGCKFLEDINRKVDTDALCAFIFECQREYLKKQKEERR